jgi:hypothetical protein
MVPILLNLDFLLESRHMESDLDCSRQPTGSYFGLEVLVLYRKREGARRLHEHGVFARFRYNDLKEAARDCGGRGLYAN